MVHQVSMGAMAAESASASEPVPSRYPMMIWRMNPRICAANRPPPTTRLPRRTRAFEMPDCGGVSGEAQLFTAITQGG